MVFKNKKEKTREIQLPQDTNNIKKDKKEEQEKIDYIEKLKQNFSNNVK